jgi:hypothetical protein
MADHPLIAPRMLANYGLLAFTGIGVALMSVQIFYLGAAICLIAVAGILSLYYEDIKRVRLKLVNGAADQDLSAEMWLALAVAGIAILAPASIYFYSTVEHRVLLPEGRHLTADQKIRMRPILRLDPTETYELQVNSAPNCDECELYADEIREFLSSIPGWKPRGSAIIFSEPFRRRRGIVIITREDEKKSSSVEKISKAFDAAGIILSNEIENYQKGQFVIVIYRST